MLESAIPAIERLESLIAATNTAQISALPQRLPQVGNIWRKCLPRIGRNKIGTSTGSKRMRV